MMEYQKPSVRTVLRSIEDPSRIAIVTSTEVGDGLNRTPEIEHSRLFEAMIHDRERSTLRTIPVLMQNQNQISGWIATEFVIKENRPLACFLPFEELERSVEGGKPPRHGDADTTLEEYLQALLVLAKNYQLVCEVDVNTARKLSSVMHFLTAVIPFFWDVTEEQNAWIHENIVNQVSFCDE